MRIHWTAEARLLQALRDGPMTTQQVIELFRGWDIPVQAVNIIGALGRTLRRSHAVVQLCSRKAHVPTRYGRTEQWIYELKRVP